MAFDYRAAMASRSENLRYAYGEDKTMLYALAVGMGRDPLDRRELPFVQEKGLRALPTLATVIAFGARDVRTLGVDYSKVLHGAQKIILHRPLPVRAELAVDTRTLAAYDKGPAKGAVIVSAVEIREVGGGEPLCTLETTHFARGDGGFSASGGHSGAAPVAHTLPARVPDLEFDVPTSANQALLYRLLGDRNPLHVDPEAAQAAGFNRPILHGLCSFGICCRALVSTVCDYRAERVREFEARFSAPAYPGETFGMEVWLDGPVVSFRASAREREVVVIDNGRCQLAGLGSGFAEGPV